MTPWPDVSFITRDALLMLSRELSEKVSRYGVDISQQWGTDDFEVPMPAPEPIEKFLDEAVRPRIKKLAEIIPDGTSLSYAGGTIPRSIERGTIERFEGIAMRGLIVWSDHESSFRIRLDVWGKVP